MDGISPRNHRGGAPGTATQAVRVGDLIFVGGQMSLDEQGRVVGRDIASQARNALEALKRVLAEVGANMADVVKHNVYLSCEGDEAAVARFMVELDRVRVAYFPDPGPTTTEVRCGLELEGALILIDAWAVVGAKKRSGSCRQGTGAGNDHCPSRTAGRSAIWCSSARSALLAATGGRSASATSRCRPTMPSATSIRCCGQPGATAAI
jgi:enamine deaminase RidA (YjgF/YER057c/UK114 family)